MVFLIHSCSPAALPNSPCPSHTSFSLSPINQSDTQRSISARFLFFIFIKYHTQSDHPFSLFLSTHQHTSSLSYIHHPGTDKNQSFLSFLITDRSELPKRRNSFSFIKCPYATHPRTLLKITSINNHPFHSTSPIPGAHPPKQPVI